MKKVLLSFVAAFFLSMSTMSNPVYFPPVFFSELYWEGNDWTIELVVAGGFLQTGNQIKMKCTAGESLLLDNLNINGTIIITSDSLEQPLQLNQQGDFVQFFYEEFNGQWYSDFGMHCFGNFPGTEVSAAAPGQSIVQYYNYDYNQRYLTKTNVQTPGEYPNDVTSYGSLEGYVFDEEGNPVEDALLEEFRFLMYTFDLTTDENGWFSTIDLMPKNYYVVTHKDDCIVHDTIMITVEPDSTAYVEIVADTCIFFEGEAEIKALQSSIMLDVYPNPFLSRLTLHLRASHPVKLTDAYVKIYDQQGKLLIDKRINSPYLTDVEMNLDDELGNFNAGVYLLAIENAGQVIASRKIIHE